MVCCLVAASSVAQPAFENRFAQPLGEVLRQAGERFGVRIVCKRFDPDTVRVAYAAFRVRPYSLPETLDGLLHPLGLVWNGTEKITV